MRIIWRRKPTVQAIEAYAESVVKVLHDHFPEESYPRRVPAEILARVVRVHVAHPGAPFEVFVDDSSDLMSSWRLKAHGADHRRVHLICIRPQSTTNVGLEPTVNEALDALEMR